MEDEDFTLRRCVWPGVNALWRPLGWLERQAVSWLWPGRVPNGKVTLLVGDPGVGKSLLALDMAARVTRGLAWPDACGSDAGARCAPQGRVVVLSAEDDAADTLLPRVEAAGGDPELVIVLRVFGRRSERGELPFALSRDSAVLENEVAELEDVRLVVLDPVSAYLGSADANHGSVVRGAMALLQGMAERTGAAVVGISHLTKRSDARVLYRAHGSLAFVAAARSAWAAGPDPACARTGGASGRMLLVPIKCNLVKRPSGLAYRIAPSAEAPEVPVVSWEAGEVALTAEEAFDARPARLGRREAAAEWLEAQLAGGPRSAAEIAARGRAAGHSMRTLRRARVALGVVPWHERAGAPWMLRLPSAEEMLVGAPARAEGATHQASPHAATV